MYSVDIKWYNNKGEMIAHDRFQNVLHSMVLGLLTALLRVPPPNAVRCLYDIALPVA